MDYAQQQALKILEASYEMYERTKKDVEKKLRDELNDDGSKKYDEGYIQNKLKEIQNAQDDIVEQYRQTGGNVEELGTKKKKKTTKTLKSLSEIASKSNTSIDTKKTTTSNTKKTTKKEKNTVTEFNTMENKENLITYIPTKKEYNPNISFDVIPLPSKGMAYRHKTDRVQVSYLTANDENMFVSPNLYRDGLLIDYLLNEKIMSAGIDPNELLDGDRDAIILWLRATGYGNEFPITATDNETGTEFNTVVDLSKIKFKEFDLKSDENGWFDFELPLSKDLVKFKFLNHRENKELKQLDNMSNLSLTKERLTAIAKELREYIDADEELGKTEKSKLYDSCRNIENWYENIEDDDTYFTPSLTNKACLQIMAINGNTNRAYIEEYVNSMNVRDSLALRKYITKNEPGLDFELEIEKPQSLGGGSQKVFLPFNQFIFLNLAD